MSRDGHEEIDRILDEALAGYSKVEPRPGLDQRVLARARVEGRQWQWAWWWRWAAVVPVFAALWIAAIVFREKPHAATKVAVVERATSPLTPPEVPEISTTGPRSRAQRHGVPRRVPRPATLSDGERALVDLVARFPEQARQFLDEPSRQAIQPIEIEKIEIAPLPVGGQQEKEQR